MELTFLPTSYDKNSASPYGTVDSALSAFTIHPNKNPAEFSAGLHDGEHQLLSQHSLGFIIVPHLLGGELGECVWRRREFIY